MYENIITLFLFLSLVLFEYFFFARKRDVIISARKIGNITFLPLTLLITVLVEPALLVGLTLFFTSKIDLSFLNTPWYLSFLFSFLILDVSMYLFHRLFHRVPFLWKIHALHHSDTHLDVTTYFRHHPLESFVSVIMTVTLVYFFSINTLVLGVYFFINNCMQLLQHSNTKLFEKWSWFEYIFVTPSFHTMHHSVQKEEANSNYSTIFSIWDRLFGSYQPGTLQPIKLGIVGFESEEYQRIDTMFALPFLIK